MDLNPSTTTYQLMMLGKLLKFPGRIFLIYKISIIVARWYEDSEVCT